MIFPQESGVARSIHTFAFMKPLSRFLASPGRVALALGLACTGLVGTSFYVQHVLGIEPCPLCIIQRFTYFGLIPVFLAAAMARTHGRAQRALFWTAAVLTLGGLGVAGYQTYLQLFPAPLVARCSASLSYMLDNLAVTEVLAQLLHATGDCSDASFRILGLSMAQASLLVFLTFTLSLITLLRRQPAPRVRSEP
jgi:disulfide bond formation protein DsbB